jgi:uncharacterized protein
LIKVDVSQILAHVGDNQPFSLVVDAAAIGETSPWFGGDITISGEIVNLGNAFRLNARISGQATLECGRCLTVFEQPIDFFLEEELETEEIDPVSGVVDIAETIRTALIFHEPMQPLCKEECKGLCYHCGADRNQHECKCDQQAIDPRLAGLSRLLE